MKEQIIHLDSHDDFQSARDKMGWTQTARVLLVWPPRGRVLARRLDLLLLHRHASRLGAHLAIITTDPEVRDHARDLGLPTFASIPASAQKRWRSRSRRLRPGVKPQPTRRDPHSWRRLPQRHWWQRPGLAWVGWAWRILFFGLGLSALGALAYTLGPSATLTLHPAITPLNVVLEVVGDPQLTQIEGSTIPARTVRVELEAEDLTATTGQRRVPDAAATGEIVFTNLTGQLIIIPPGTGLRTTSGTPVRFQTTKQVVLEARLGATVVVPIEALDLGPQGNVAAGQINAIDGPLGLSLAAANPSATAGGAESFKAAIAATDQARVRAQLLAHLQTEAATALLAQLRPDEVLVGGSLTTTAILVESYDGAVGDAADTVRLKLRVAFTGLSVSETQAQQVALAALAAQVPEGQALLPDQEVLTRASDPVLRDGHAVFTMRASSQLVPLVDVAAVRDAIKGQPRAVAQLRVAEALPLAEFPALTIWPAGIDRVPLMVFRIEVVVE